MQQRAQSNEQAPETPLRIQGEPRDESLERQNLGLHSGAPDRAPEAARQQQSQPDTGSREQE